MTLKIENLSLLINDICPYCADKNPISDFCRRCQNTKLIIKPISLLDLKTLLDGYVS